MRGYDHDAAALEALQKLGAIGSSLLVEDADLAGFSGRVSDSGEGRWTAMAVIDEEAVRRARREERGALIWAMPIAVAALRRQPMRW